MSIADGNANGNVNGNVNDSANTDEKLQLRLLDYLYGELSEEETLQFEELLKSNPALQQQLDTELQFNSAFPVGSQPQIEEERIEGNRWVLRQNLQREARPGFSLSGWFKSLAQRPLTVAFQGAAMAMTFVLGVMIATPETGSVDSIAVDQIASNVSQSSPLSPLSLVNDDDFEIYQLKVNNYDAETGAIDLSFALASETRLQGNVSDRNINQLMAVALQDDIDSASRLDTIQALQPVASGNEVYEALIHVLMNDQNPGVRYQAVQALVDLSYEEKVREALRFALSEDVNQGVRVEAFNALVNYRDERTLDVFRVQMEEDSNEYIRTQARSIVEGDDASIAL